MAGTCGGVVLWGEEGRQGGLEVVIVEVVVEVVAEVAVWRGGCVGRWLCGEVVVERVARRGAVCLSCVWMGVRGGLF